MLSFKFMLQSMIYAEEMGKNDAMLHFLLITAKLKEMTQDILVSNERY